VSPLSALSRLLLIAALLVAVVPGRAGAAEPTTAHPVVVGDQGIGRTAIAHWEGELGSRAAAVRFLVHDRWLRGEARRHGVVVPRAQVRRGASADARVRARAAAYAKALRAHAAGSVDAFTAAWTAWWQPQTHCAPAFFVADVCAAPGAPLKALTPRPRLSPSA
jgi:hypothetical protein